jgi:hypothetical protein
MIHLRETRVRLASAIAVTLLLTACGSDATDPPNAATGMRFSVQPASTTAGQPFSVSVELVDPRGNRLASASDSVTIAAEDQTPLTGTTVAVASGGVATFSNVVITRANPGVSLIAASRTLAAVSDIFGVGPALPSAQTSSLGPASTPLTIGVTRNVTLTFTDPFGNRISGQPISVTSNLTGVTLAPSSGTTTSAGAFSFAVKGTIEGSLVITASVAGVQIPFPPLVIQPPCTPFPLTLPGSASGELPTETCIVAGTSGFIYSFTMLEPGAAIFSLTSGFQSALQVTKDHATDDLVLRGGTSQSGEWLLPAGAFQVRVGTISGSGDFTLAASTGPGDQGQVIRNILVGGAYAQSLGTGDSRFPEIFGDESFWDIFRVESDAPCTISARGTGAPPLDLLLVIADSVGDPLVADDNSGGGNDPQVSLDSCQINGGPVRIMVNHYLDVPSGPYTLTVALDGAAATGAGRARTAVSWPEFLRRLPERKSRVPRGGSD